MASDDFAAAFLKGLYEGGVGNSAVNERRKANQLEEQQKMAAKGMVPQEDPMHSKIADHVKSIFFPGSGNLADAYKPDPNRPTFGIDSSGSSTMAPGGQKLPEGYAPIPYEKGIEELGKQGRLKDPKTWTVVSGMTSKSGKPLLVDKDGNMKEGTMDVNVSSGSNMAGVREKQFGLQDLPSNQPPSTAGGAAYQVVVAGRQGKSLIAKPGSAQRTGLATGDLARAILRATPTDETAKNANFSDNLVTRISKMRQNLTADPSVVNNPKVRREMYDIFDEMVKSATPFIKNQLDDMESMGFKVPPAVRKRQMGETLPDVPFVEDSGGDSNHPAVGGMFNGKKITKVEPL